MSDNSISLKIIRLSKPTVASGDILSLPSSFGSIYLGQEFEALLVLNNESGKILRDISIKAELQTTNSRFSLLEDTLEELTLKNYKTTHEIKELGIHILVCTVSYTLESERKIQRKFYKFQVLNPLSLKLQTQSLNGTWVEIILTNISNFSIVLHQMKFCSTTSHVDYNQYDKLMVPKESRQYLYFLKESDEILGKCDLNWSFDNGSRGRLVTANLQKKVSGTMDVFSKIVVHVPSSVKVEEKFNIILDLPPSEEKIKDNIQQLNFNKQLLMLSQDFSRDKANLSFLALYPGFYSLKLLVDSIQVGVEILVRNEFSLQVKE